MITKEMKCDHCGGPMPIPKDHEGRLNYTVSKNGIKCSATIYRDVCKSCQKEADELFLPVIKKWAERGSRC